MDDLYNKAISFYNEGEYEKALDAIRNSSMATSKESLGLIRECEKLILEQHVYLIKEYIEQQDYLNASRKKEEYETKYGSNPKIENIIIPYASVVDRKECSEHQISNNQSQQSVQRKLPLYRKLLCMKRMGLIIIAIIALSLISLLGYRSYRSTGELQKKKLYEDSIRVVDSIAAIEAAEEEYEEYQRQESIKQEQEQISNPQYIKKYNFKIYYPDFLELNCNGEKNYNLKGDNIYWSITFYKKEEKVHMYNDFVINSLNDAYNWEVLLQDRGGYTPIDDVYEKNTESQISGYGKNENGYVHIIAFKNLDNSYYCVCNIQGPPNGTNTLSEVWKYLIHIELE